MGDAADTSPESLLGSFVSRDRRAALADGRTISDRLHGAGLFADISGFTPLTEALAQQYGDQRGAEELGRTLDRVYHALVDDLGRHRGEVLYFSGDAITCWIDGDDGEHAIQCALDMQATMQRIGSVEIDGHVHVLSVKVAVAMGSARRFVVGDPEIQLHDVIAGRLVDQLAAAESLADKGDVIADQSVLELFGDRLECSETRRTESGRRCGVVRSLRDPPSAGDPPDRVVVDLAHLRPWVLPAVAERLLVGGGTYLAELRTVHTIFVRFGGFAFDDDAGVESHLDEFIRQVQHTLGRFDGVLLGITVGDKGAYIVGVVGAPRSHEDDAVRAVAAAVELRDLERTTGARDLQVGVSNGRVFCGTYGHPDRRTYSALGDAVNVSARLMGSAPPGEVYVLESVADRCDDRFLWADLEPLRLKGKSEPVRARAAVLTRKRTPARVLRYPLPMVGRDGELARADAALDAAEQGERRIVSVTAAAGMGKSRFVAEVLRSAADRSLPVAYGQAESMGTTTSYLVWRNVWRAIFGLDDERPDSAQARDLDRVLRMVDPRLAARLPLLAPVVGVDIPDNDLVARFDAKLRKSSLENLVTDVLVDRLGAGPLVIVLEDLQWADGPSLDLLESLLRPTDHLPLFVLLSRRPDADGRGRAPGVPGLVDVVLDDLDDNAMRAVVDAKMAQVFGTDHGASDALVRLVVGRSAGNPFYAEELVNYVRKLGRDPGDPEAVTESDLPDSLQAIVLSRIDGLDEHARQAVKVASVIGREFDVPMLGAVHGDLGSRDEVVSRLEPSRAIDLVLPRDEAYIDWLFRHAITRDVAYESLPFSTRSALHERVGDAIVDAGDTTSSLDVVAHHYWLADDDEKKRRHLRLAGDAARDRYANEAALEHYTRLATLVTEGERADVLLDLASVLEVSGSWDEAESTAAEARSIADGLPDPVRTAWADVALAELARKHGDYGRAAELLDAAASTFTTEGEESGRARVHHLLGILSSTQGDLAMARAHYEQSREIRERLGDQAGLAAIWSNLGIAAEYDGDFAASRRFHEAALEIRRAIGDRWAIAVSHTNLGMIAVLEKRFDDARALFEEAMRLNLEVGDTWMVAITHNNLGNAWLGLGDADAARVHFGQSLEIHRRYDDRWALGFLYEDIALLAAAEGDPMTALELLGAADRVREEGDAWRPETREAELDEALSPATGTLPAAEQATIRARGRSRSEPAAFEHASSYCRHGDGPN